jgi:hypothetical protein
MHQPIRSLIPEDVRLNFERVRTAFIHGLLSYDLFSAAHSLGQQAELGAIALSRDRIGHRLAAG